MQRVIAAVVALWSSVAFAQSSAARAEVLFRQGRELMAAGKLAEACDAFEDSQRVEPAVTTLLNLAGCREKLGQIATAWSLFVEAARRTRWAADPASQQLHTVAQDHAQELEPRLSKLTINVPLQSQLDGLEIMRGGDRVTPVLWNRALPLDGGTYTITVRAPGANPWSTQVTVAAESDVKTVEVPDLRNLPRDLVPAVVAAPPAARAPAPAAPRRVLPYALAAGALALLGGGLALELSAESKYDAARAEQRSQTRRDSLEDAANTRRYGAQALAAGGLVAGGVAVWLYLRHRKAAETRATVRVVPTTSGLALAGGF